MKPHRATILAVDPGATSGVALFLRGTLSESTEVDIDSNLVERWAGYALTQAIRRGETLVMVGESWGHPKGKGPRSWGGAGPAWSIWKRSLKLQWSRARKLGHSQPAPKVVSVHMQRWRSKIYGGRVGKGAAKAVAVMSANQRFGLELKPEQHDQAEACLIGLYATMAPEVLDVIPQRFR